MLFIANWKTRFTYRQAVAFASTNLNEFIALSKLDNKQIILCPSFESISSITHLFANTKISVGAQDCSAYAKGNYTGQVLVESLAELQCSYCIIGHSERRLFNHETDQEIAEKFKILMGSTITPVLCIGETKQEYEQGHTLKTLEKQLSSVFNEKHSIFDKNKAFYIAYEPIWSIGTGLVASYDHLQSSFVWLAQHLQKFCSRQQFRLIYGGSVSLASMPLLYTINELDGFLIGGASVNFEEFKKIVTYSK